MPNTFFPKMVSANLGSSHYSDARSSVHFSDISLVLISFIHETSADPDLDNASPPSDHNCADSGSK